MFFSHNSYTDNSRANKFNISFELKERQTSDDTLTPLRHKHVTYCHTGHVHRTCATAPDSAYI